MEPKKPLPKIWLQNAARDTVNSASLTNGQKTVFYFWSQTQMNHYRTSLERVAKFKANFPDIRFIGICIQPFNTMVDEVQKIMEVDKENQYALIDFENASKAWVLTLLNKAKHFIHILGGNFLRSWTHGLGGRLVLCERTPRGQCGSRHQS